MDRSLRLDHVIRQFFRDYTDIQIQKFGSGLIHRTFFLRHTLGNFILQQINQTVFPNPDILMENIQIVGNHLKHQNYDKSILEIRPTLDAQLYFRDEANACWRVFNFIGDTQYFSEAHSVTQVYEVGKSFGAFLFYLKDLPLKKIKPAIPNFHNLNFRFEKLEKAIEVDKYRRLIFAKKEVAQIYHWKYLIKQFNTLVLPTRIVHADPKINNLLFDKKGNVKAVVDWDTIMPGNVLFDFGDLVRTTCCEVNEESVEWDRVKISTAYLQALEKGFRESTDSFLTEIEKDNLMLGAKAIIFEQAIRFLTDFLEGDVYYNTTYTEHNLNRTKNQLLLLSRGNFLLPCDL